MCWKTSGCTEGKTTNTGGGGGREQTQTEPSIRYPAPSLTRDNAKVEVMTPHVTNQADKEQGLLWADTQLWVQLCTVVRPARSLSLHFQNSPSSIPLFSPLLSCAGTGLAQHISKISCSDSSFSPNPAIMKSYAIVASCGFGRHNTNLTQRDRGGRRRTATMTENWRSRVYVWVRLNSDHLMLIG